MKNHIILAVGLTVLVAVGFVSNMPNAVAVAKQQQTQQEEAAIGVEFARLVFANDQYNCCLLYTSPSPRDATLSRMPSSA